MGLGCFMGLSIELLAHMCTEVLLFSVFFFFFIHIQMYILTPRKTPRNA